MKKLVALVVLLFSAMALFAGFAEECQKVEQWINATYPAGSVSFRMQHNRLRQIRQSQDSEAKKIEKLHQQFPHAFVAKWELELRTAKAQGIAFSDDNKTLIKCPENITEVVIPSCVTTIGEMAFSGCTGLTSVTIPDSVTTIGEGAFSGCTGLTSVSVPGNVQIGERAFPSGCEVTRR